MFWRVPVTRETQPVKQGAAKKAILARVKTVEIPSTELRFALPETKGIDF